MGGGRAAERAEQLARSITDPDRQAGCWPRSAKALVAAGQPDQAEQLATAADSWPAASPTRTGRPEALAEVGKALAAAGQPDRAEQLARTIRDPDRRSALAEVGKALAAAGQPDRAEQLARSITDPYLRAWALTEVGRALVTAGQPDRAEQLARPPNS